MEPRPATSPTSSSADDQQRGRFVPWIIVGFFVCFVLLLSSFVWIAFSHKPSEVTANAYQKGLAYNNALEAAQKQKALGWVASLAFDGKSRLTLTLSDKDKNPIKGAQARAWFVHSQSAAMDQSADMQEVQPGQYEVIMPAPRRGAWEARATVLHGGNEFQISKPVVVQ